MLMAIHSLRQKLYALAKEPRSSHQRVITGLDACMIITVMLISGDAQCLPIQAGDEERQKKKCRAGTQNRVHISKQQKSSLVPQAPGHIPVFLGAPCEIFRSYIWRLVSTSVSTQRGSAAKLHNGPENQKTCGACSMVDLHWVQKAHYLYKQLYFLNPQLKELLASVSSECRETMNRFEPFRMGSGGWHWSTNQTSSVRNISTGQYTRALQFF